MARSVRKEELNARRQVSAPLDSRARKLSAFVIGRSRMGEVIGTWLNRTGMREQFDPDRLRNPSRDCANLIQCEISKVHCELNYHGHAGNSTISAMLMRLPKFSTGQRCSLTDSFDSETARSGSAPSIRGLSRFLAFWFFLDLRLTQATRADSLRICIHKPNRHVQSDLTALETSQWLRDWDRRDGKFVDGRLLA